MKTNRRPRILLSAYACQPNVGSEPGMSWNTAVALTGINDVFVITNIYYKPVIEIEMRKNPVARLYFHYYDIPLGNKLWNRLKFTKKLTWELDYLIWQLTVIFSAKKICSIHNIDIIHHISFVRYWTPSSLAFLKQPFIWGPVGAGDALPASFLKLFSRAGRRFEKTRNPDILFS